MKGFKVTATFSIRQEACDCYLALVQAGRPAKLTIDGPGAYSVHYND
jgi:hypothetical protein